MKRTTLIVALAVVAATAAVLPAAAVQTDAESTNAPAATAGTDSTSIAPGARLSGVVGVQGAEIDGEVESRAFGQRVADATTDEAKAKVVGEQHNDSERRLAELERRLEALERARDNGSISNDTYAARAATIQARLDNIERMSNETKDASEGLPRDVLEANGVNVTAIDTLGQRASELAGPEVAAIARSIAGPGASRAPPGVDDRRRGPPVNETAAGDGGDGNRTAGTTDGRDGGNDTDDGPDEGTENASSGGYGARGGS